MIALHLLFLYEESVGIIIMGNDDLFSSLVALKLNIDVVYNKEARTSQRFRYIILD